MNITILGAGNIGTLLAAHLATNKNNQINLYTSDKSCNNKIVVYDKDDNYLFSSIVNFSNSLEECLPASDIIFITYPSNIWVKKAKEIEQHIRKNSYIIFVPGMGGKEYISKKLIENNPILGMQRVPYIARLKEKGKSVYQLSVKDEVFLGSINLKDLSIIDKIQELLDIKCTYLDNYLTLTLTPSNPILHTSRIYSMFKDNKYYNYEPFFYKEWDIKSAKNLFACDAELQIICQSLDKLNLSGVRSLKLHYESNTEEQLVDKLQNIESFKKIKAPVIEKDGKFYPDFNSRYFKEDFPFGLLIIKGFAVICNISTPNIDKIINWYQKNIGKEYLVDNKLTGKDLKETGIPQNYGIDTKEKIYQFYKNKL